MFLLPKGMPHIQFSVAMEAEHCSKVGSTLEFTTGNYNITTTPAQEWAVVVNRVDPPQTVMGHSRRIPDIQTLMNSEVSLNANLTREEVIAVVMYTGPMVRNFLNACNLILIQS
jgi:hypothetical protein